MVERTVNGNNAINILILCFPVCAGNPRELLICWRDKAEFLASLLVLRNIAAADESNRETVSIDTIFIVIADSASHRREGHTVGQLNIDI